MVGANIYTPKFSQSILAIDLCSLPPLSQEYQQLPIWCGLVEILLSIYGGQDRTCTYTLVVMSHMLYYLSYISMAGRDRVELPFLASKANVLPLYDLPMVEVSRIKLLFLECKSSIISLYYTPMDCLERIKLSSQSSQLYILFIRT